MVDMMYRYPNENWFDDHPDASVVRVTGQTGYFAK